jgi:hypothetical protein
MQLPLDLRPAIPASEPGRLRRVAQRTRIVRVALAASLVVALALAFLVARSQDVRQAPLVPAGTTGMLVLDLSASVYEGALDNTIAKLLSTDERTGLVVFSDSAYELLPPGAPSRELQSLQRFFKARPDGTLPVNPWDEFRAGTRISTGVDFARRSLLRENVTKGSIVLVSDLEILPDEVAKVSEALALARADGFQVRIVPLFPSAEKRALVEQLVGKDTFLAAPEEIDVRTPQERSIVPPLPWLFLVSVLVVALILALNEGVLTRLEVRR